MRAAMAWKLMRDSDVRKPKAAQPAFRVLSLRRKRADSGNAE
eukprot:CAMPEP_0174350718 /NCGR_PEP_ID=MMETSP0811_2-20130205/7859_1 /TAXON_ID=73025 ORGANISM="Eutreptiella gymnastica-like, Strain CCMP1594" /NCGR_SAMPLE_ID=MMETSP0811_2 /ASSEMBLY_ACC=CAM_ASM_000667 /LENGTH=41 /DNA_ID= /DNA_START= /DNA_END= /DNA_ORIENTATION=